MAGMLECAAAAPAMPHDYGNPAAIRS